MPDDATPPAASSPPVSLRWWRLPLILIASPLALLLAIPALLTFFALALPAATLHLVRTRTRSRRLLSRLAHDGRTVSWAYLENRQPLAGTFILDSVTLGWNEARLWWTEDDVPALAARAGLPPLDEAARRDRVAAGHPPGDLETQRWCLRRYLGPAAGPSRLVQIVSSARGRRRLDARLASMAAAHPQLRVVRIHSAFVHLSDAGSSRRDNG